MGRHTRIILRTAGMLLTLAAVGAAAGIYWRALPDSMRRVMPFFDKTEMVERERFVDGVRYGGTARLYEGLPHAHWEGALLKSELAAKGTIRSKGYPFYEKEITPTEKDAAALAGLAISASSFKKWAGVKLCGGYHPDWLIRWTAADGATHELQVCFGCHEGMLIGRDYSLYCDLEDAAYESFKEILAKYAEQRPARPKRGKAAARETGSTPPSEGE